MERLTERFGNGQAAVMGCGENCKYDYKYCRNHYEDCPEINRLYERLAEYEDAGLTPEQIMELKARDEAMEINEIHVDEYYCPACGSENNCDQGVVEDNFCPRCGQRLKWEE